MGDKGEISIYVHITLENPILKETKKSEKKKAKLIK